MLDSIEWDKTVIDGVGDGKSEPNEEDESDRECHLWGAEESEKFCRFTFLTNRLDGFCCITLRCW